MTSIASTTPDSYMGVRDRDFDVALESSPGHIDRAGYHLVTNPTAGTPRSVDGKHSLG